MDLSQYAELFLAESREHLSACNQLLLEWERTPASHAPVAGLFRAVEHGRGVVANGEPRAIVLLPFEHGLPRQGEGGEDVLRLGMREQSAVELDR